MSVNNYLDDKDPEIIKAVMDKGIISFIKIYNSFCRHCRKLAQENSERPFQDYCNICRKKIERILS
jgi:hypothetical protein